VFEILKYLVMFFGLIAIILLAFLLYSALMFALDCRDYIDELRGDRHE